MKFKFNNKYVRWGLTSFLVIAASITFYYLIFHSSNIHEKFSLIMGILMPVIFGLVTAYLLTPILNFMESRVLVPLFDKFQIRETRSRRKVIHYQRSGYPCHGFFVCGTHIRTYLHVGLPDCAQR